MDDANLELIESLCKILNKHKLDSLEYSGIKITKSKHDLIIKSVPIIKKDKKQDKLKKDLKNPEFVEDSIFADPDLYLAVE